MNDANFVIVGAGHSGLKAAVALRKQGWTGRISLIGEESYLPYDRPPLSKAVLLGQRTAEQCTFFPLSWFTENSIDLAFNDPAVELDRSRKSVSVASGKAISYSKLLFATGSAIRPLVVPGATLSGVFPLRAPHDAEAIEALLRPGRTVAIIGAGVIGLEVAAAAIERGCRVRVLEAAPVAMARSLPSIISEAVIAEHRARGVDIDFGVSLAALDGRHSVSAVVLTNGQTIECDMVVFGVGVTPRTELAEAAGLSVSNGILTNGYLQTDDEAIFACGDVCRYSSALFGNHIRLENWRNAEDQSGVAAGNMLGKSKTFDEVPWFWSNQYASALQVFGLPTSASTTTIHQMGSSKLFLSFGTDGTLLGVSGFGHVKDIAMPLRKLKAAIAHRYIADDINSIDPDALLSRLLSVAP